jgi:hypothetical protein
MVMEKINVFNVVSKILDSGPMVYVNASRVITRMLKITTAFHVFKIAEAVRVPPSISVIVVIKTKIEY